MHLGGPLPCGRVTPYRAAKLAARRSRSARKAGVSAHSGDGRFCNPILAVKPQREPHTSVAGGRADQEFSQRLQGPDCRS
jgi:hypothetical protein